MHGATIQDSPPSSAEVKNEWIYTSTPPVCLHGVKQKTFFMCYLQSTIIQ